MRILRNLLGITLVVFFATSAIAPAQQPSTTTAAAAFLFAKQESFNQSIEALARAGTAVDFYRFGNDQSNTGLEVAKHSLIFFYRDTTTNNLSLIIIMSSPANNTPGAASLNFEGLPPSAQILVRDDGSDTYNFTPPTATLSWTWLGEHSDGVVINGLPEEFEIKITPTFTQGIEQWMLLNGPDAASPTRIRLPSLAAPLTLTASRRAPPRASFSYSPATVNVNVPVTFDATSSTTSEGKIVKYEWDFNGDEVFEVSTDKPKFTYTFTTGGEMKVSLKVTDEKGASASTSQIIRIAADVSLARRAISTTHATPNSTFRVTVTIEVRTSLNGLGLDEDIPANWDINPIDNAGATFKRATTQWVFPNIIKAGETKRIVYDVKIPETGRLVSGPLPANFELKGQIDSASPSFKAPVTGEKQIQAVACLPVEVAISHLDTSTDTIDLRLSEDVTTDEMQRAVAYWMEEQEVPETCANKVDLQTLKRIVARNLSNTATDKALAEERNGEAASQRFILTPLPFHQVYLKADGGNVFRVRVEIKADRDLYGLALDENLPSRWDVRSIESGNASFKQSELQWIFPEKILAGETRTVIYEVQVPKDESVDLFKIDGTIDSVLPLFDVTVAGETDLEVVQCVAVPVAVSHWDVDKNIIDVALSNKIDFNQIQAAIASWLEDEEVPGTCGKTIDFETMKTLIAFWLTDSPVDLPLPMSVNPGR
jgi:PKD repeat protein